MKWLKAGLIWVSGGGGIGVAEMVVVVKSGSLLNNSDAAKLRRTGDLSSC